VPQTDEYQSNEPNVFAEVTMKTERVVLEAIDSNKRLRPLNEGAVVAMMESMKQLGQLQPISLHSPNPSEIIIVAGTHRMEAAKRLGWDFIEATFVTGSEIDLELHEIAENLHRAELTALERDTQIARWVELVEAKVRQLDEPPPGGKQKTEKGQAKAARELGISEPDARRAVKVASIAPEAKQAARDAGLDDNRTALLQVAKEATPDEQVAKVAEISADRAAAKRTKPETKLADVSKNAKADATVRDAGKAATEIRALKEDINRLNDELKMLRFSELASAARVSKLLHQMERRAAEANSLTRRNRELEEELRRIRHNCTCGHDAADSQPKQSGTLV
jgi:ParB-like chromosome segregation protein Spo0J